MVWHSSCSFGYNTQWTFLHNYHLLGSQYPSVYISPHAFTSDRAHILSLSLTNHAHHKDIPRRPFETESKWFSNQNICDLAFSPRIPKCQISRSSGFQVIGLDLDDKISRLTYCSEIYQVTGPVERFAGQIASQGFVVGKSFRNSSKL